MCFFAGLKQPVYMFVGRMFQHSIFVAYCNSSWSNFEDWRTVWMRLAKLDMGRAINMGVIPTNPGEIPTNLGAIPTNLGAMPTNLA